MQYAKFLKENKKIIIAVIKLIASIIAVMCVARTFYGNGLDSYYTEKIYDYQNDLTNKESSVIDLSEPVLQEFLSKGQSLTSIRIYISDLQNTDTNLNVVLMNSSKIEIADSSVHTSELSADQWNTIEMNISGLDRGSTYIIKICTENGDTGVISGTAENTDDGNYLTSCRVNDSEISGCLAVGIHQVCRYITLPYALWMGIDALLLFAFLFCILYTIFNIETCVAAAKQYKCKECWLYAIVFSVSVLMIFNPMDSVKTEIQKFSRVIGSGVLSGYDVSNVIGNFNNWFLAFALLMVAMLLFFSFIKNQKYTLARVATSERVNYSGKLTYTEREQEAWSFLDKFMILAFVNLVLRAITFFADESTGDDVFYYSSYIISIVIVFTLVYIIGKLSRWIDFSSCFSVFVAALAVGYPAAVMVKAEWADGRLLLGIQVILLLLALILLVAFTRKDFEIPHRQTILCAVVITASSLPLLLSLCIEFINVLAGQGIYFITIRQCYALLTLAVMVVCLVLIKVLVNRKKLPDENKIAFPLLVFGVSALSVQVQLTGTYTADIVEGANSSILISDFLNFGDIPLVSHYGGHMMTEVWEGVLYGLVNQDYIGAAFSPYSSYITPVIAVLFYFLAKKICGEKEALLITLFFPFYSSVSYYGQGILIILAVVAFIKKNSYARALLIWLACIWCSLYRLDMGYAFDIACLVVLVCYIVVEKKWKAIKPLLTTLAACGIVGLTAWVLLCMRADVNPISRLLEFLELSASNQNWAYNNIGNSTYTMYFWCYILMPLLVEGSLLYVIFSKRFKNKAGMVWYILIVLGVSYFVNFSRGLVRHSLVETSLTYTLWTASLYLAVFASAQFKQKSFLPIFTILILMTQLFESDANFSSVSLADTAGTKITLNLYELDSCQIDRIEKEDSENKYKSYWALAKADGEAVQRVVIDETLVEHLKPLEYLTDILLKDDETYVDFINHTLSYSYLQKENPVYVSQSPLQLSGEYTQEQFISEISHNKDSNPIIVMPYDNEECRHSLSLDGIANVVRYYKVAEYIYQNYVPLCHYGEYAVWCLSDRYDEMIESLGSEEVEYIDVLKDGIQTFNAFNMDIKADETGILLSYTGIDPYLDNFNDYLEITEFVGASVRIVIEYESDTDGAMQLFYTEDSDENFSEGKSISVALSSEGGTVEFTVPITEYTRIRLDIPEQSQVKLTSVKLCSPIELIDYGYDRFVSADNGAYYVDSSKSLHVYSLDQLAKIWGELDTEEAASNEVAATVDKQGDQYFIQNVSQIDKENGNYLLINAAYYGKDAVGYTKEDDESVTATVCLGVTENGTFIEKYRYTMTVEEGTHQYLIRISCDYFWYADEIDTVVLDCDETLANISMSVLCGD
ncbi:MAG: hypothetical protein LUI13_12415 [Lachnospiraceae bacterium]|nr:hypothetical protein [Lachnospiraceae bacterium]